jgi:hypothetical protein
MLLCLFCCCIFLGFYFSLHILTSVSCSTINPYFSFLLLSLLPSSSLSPLPPPSFSPDSARQTTTELRGLQALLSSRERTKSKYVHPKRKFSFAYYAFLSLPTFLPSFFRSYTSTFSPQSSPHLFSTSLSLPLHRILSHCLTFLSDFTLPFLILTLLFLSPCLSFSSSLPVYPSLPLSLSTLLFLSPSLSFSSSLPVYPSLPLSLSILLYLF